MKYYSVFLEGLNEGIVAINVTFTDEEVSVMDASSIRLYLWNSNFWIPADHSDITGHIISGEFSIQDRKGTNAATVAVPAGTGDPTANYNVTVEPEDTPDMPLVQTPKLNIAINPDANISGIYYQMDDYSSIGWILIPSSHINVSAWISLAEGTHATYFSSLWSMPSASEMGVRFLDVSLKAAQPRLTPSG